MPKKAGPKRINPETFEPVVFNPRLNAGLGVPILVCLRRTLRGRDVIGGPHDGSTVEHAIFPAAIALSDEPTVQFSLLVVDHVWERSAPEEHGISTRAAKAALAQAWHGTTSTYDLATLSAFNKPTGPAWAAHKNGVRRRNLVIALAWDRWNAAGLTVPQRAERLTSAGMPCTPRQMSAFAEQHGLSGNPG